eukprot:COSAG01_NODE_824_length_13299_cov_22.451364_5_plen_54_part_00
MQLMRSSLFCNNEDYLQFYLKWLAAPLVLERGCQAVSPGFADGRAGSRNRWLY